jgi:hypothetical protein
MMGFPAWLVSNQGQHAAILYAKCGLPADNVGSRRYNGANFALGVHLKQRKLPLFVRRKAYGNDYNEFASFHLLALKYTTLRGEKCLMRED